MTFAQCHVYRKKLADLYPQDVADLTSGPASAQTHVSKALAWANLQLKDFPFPEDAHAMDAFPGMDPRGHYSAIDMAFTQRLNKIQASAYLLSPLHRETMTQLMQQMAHGNTPFGKAYHDMMVQSRNLRLASRAQKLCLHQGGFDQLTQRIHAINHAPAVATTNTILTVMEHITGIHSQPLSQSQQQQAQSLLHLSSAKLHTLHETAHVVDAQWRQIPLPFENFNHLVTQRYFAQSAHWGKPLANVPLQDAKQWDAFATASPGQMLNALFHATEARNGNDLRPAGFNRGTLLSVDGKPICDWMLSAFQALPQTDRTTYPAWYKANLEPMSAQLVAAGLLANKRVEFFIPDKKGRLSKTPIAMVKKGYDPAQQSPDIVHAWKTFCTNQGFSPQQAPSKEDDASILAGRERIKAMSAYARLTQSSHQSSGVQESYMSGHPNWRTLDTPGHLKTNGVMPFVVCASYLAMHGHSLEEIYDPTQLQEEKVAAANVYITMATGTNGGIMPSRFPEETDAHYGARLRNTQLYNLQLLENEKQCGQWLFHGQQALKRLVDIHLEQGFYLRLGHRPDFPLLSAAAKDIVEIDALKHVDGIAQGYGEQARLHYAQTPALLAQVLHDPTLQQSHTHLPAKQAHAQRCADHASQRALGATLVIARTGVEWKAKATSPSLALVSQLPLLLCIADAEYAREQMQRLAEASPDVEASALCPYGQMVESLQDLHGCVQAQFSGSLFDAPMDNPQQRTLFFQQLCNGSLGDCFIGLSKSQNLTLAVEVCHKTMAQPFLDLSQPTVEKAPMVKS